MSIFTCDALRIARFIEGSLSFTCQAATHSFIHEWNEPSCIPAFNLQLQHVTTLWLVLISVPQMVGG